MKKLLFSLYALLGCFLLHAQMQGPGEYSFSEKKEYRDTWTKSLPKDIEKVSPTCALHHPTKTVYFLAELCGLPAGYETEFVAIGPLSDRAYESFAITCDKPSVIGKAIEKLGTPRGTPPATLAGLGVTKGERFTFSVKRLPADETFRPLSDFICDEFAPEGQSPLTRGFPYIGVNPALDDTMPSAFAATYTEPCTLFGLPLLAPKSAVYGLYRTKTSEAGQTPAIFALKWEQLPNQSRVYNHAITINSDHIARPDTLLAQLRALAEDPRDVFLTITIAPEVKLSTVAPFATLLLALEKEGAYTIDVAPKDQLSLRAFNPDDAWNDRSKRVFQPWEIEVTPSETPGEPHITLCQILEDWTVEGNDPALTRQCYPSLSVKDLPAVMKKVDVNEGKVYVAFIYTSPEATMQDIGPIATAIAPLTPTQWLFIR